MSDELYELNLAIKNAHDDPKRYHYINEHSMINKIVLGMSVKEFRKLNGIKKDSPIDPYLTPSQLEAFSELRKCDIGFLEVGKDYQERKQLLTECYKQLNK